MNRAALALATSLLAATSAWAEPATGQAQSAPSNARAGAMLLSVQTCTSRGFDVAQFRDAFANELRDMGAVTLHALEAPGLNVLAETRLEELACGAPARSVAVQLVDRLTHKTLSRGVELSGVDATARSRLLALSAIELLRASWLELEQQERRQVVADVVRLGREVRVSMHHAPIKPTSEAPIPNPIRESNHYSLGIQATVTQWASYRASVAGVAVPLSFETPRYRLFAGLGASHGQSVDALGDITLNAVQVGVGADLTTLALARGGESSSALRFGVGPRVDLGRVFLSAEAATGASAKSGQAWLLGAGLGMSVAGDVSPSVALRGSIDGGVMLASARALAAERPAVGISGPYVALKFGADFRL